MSKYIENLTDNIINKNNYWITFGRLQKQRGTFIDLVGDELERNEVRNMTGETLGKIMCSIETGDVMIGKKNCLTLYTSLAIVVICFVRLSRVAWPQLFGTDFIIYHI